MVLGVLGEQVARAVELVDEAAAVVVLVPGVVWRDEAPVQVADAGRVDLEARAQVVVLLAEDVGDGRERFPVDGDVAPVERCRSGRAGFLDDPQAVELDVCELWDEISES